MIWNESFLSDNYRDDFQSWRLCQKSNLKKVDNNGKREATLTRTITLCRKILWRCLLGDLSLNRNEMDDCCFFRSTAQSHFWWIILEAKASPTWRQISFLLLFNYVKSSSLKLVIKSFSSSQIFFNDLHLRFLQLWMSQSSVFAARRRQFLINHLVKYLQSNYTNTSHRKSSCHLSIDFRFDINDRKVESTDKHECERWSIKNNCVLFK